MNELSVLNSSTVFPASAGPEVKVSFTANAYRKSSIEPTGGLIYFKPI